MKPTWVCCCLGLLLLGCEPSQQKESTASAADSNSLDLITTAFLRHHQGAGENGSDSLVRQLSRALQAQGVDTILYFRSGCVGCEPRYTAASSSCACSTEALRSDLYWQAQGRTYRKPLDCCRNHPAGPASPAVFAFYYRHQRELEERTRFYRELTHYNQTHPGKPRFLPSGPVHGRVSYVRLLTPGNEFEAYVRASEYDSLGVPRFLDYPWRRRQWQWAQLFDQPTTERI